MAWQADAELLDLLIEWEDRRAFGESVSVETLCADRPHRAAEVRAAVAHLAGMESILGWETAEAHPLTDLPGFEVTGWLGGGGMGDVYLATDLALARPVAVKVPKPIARRIARGRFEREGRTLARLRHPGVVPVFAAGVTDAGVPYLVMEHVPGGTLAARLRNGPLSPAKAAHLGVRVARAIHYAHGKGVFHRDLKPSNILFAADGSPLVVDFGVAAVLAGESAATEPAAGGATKRLTATVGAVGTHAYCAPELLRGDGEPGPATDVWSLGVSLYQTVTGALPFDGADGEELKRAVLAGSYPPLRERNPAVPAGFAAIIGRCLAPSADGRFATAEAVAVALERWQQSRVRGRLIRQWSVGAAILFTLAVLAVVGLRPLPDEKRHARECERIAGEMQRGDDVVLVPANGPPRTALVRLNEASRRTAEDDAVVFDSRTTLPVLVELASDPGVPAYRLSADLRHDSGFMLADIGLYVCHSVDPATGANDFLYLRFSDRGDLAVAFPGAGWANGGLAQLRFMRAWRPTDLPPATRPITHSFWSVRWECPPPPLPLPATGPWRPLVIEVTPEVVRCQYDGREVHSVRIADCVRGVGRNAVITPRGGLGLYLCHSSVAVRNCVLKPLPPR